MAENARPVKRGGKYCVAGGPNKVSCQNTSYSPGLSMHYFPSDQTLRLKWTRFVQRHRANFQPTKTSVLCSAHFEESCFTKKLSLVEPDIGKGSKRVLNKGAFPTRDTIVPEAAATQELSSRGKRQVSN